MEDFAPTDEALQYWFWFVRVGDLSFLVDFILRRGPGQAENRVSVWLRGDGRIEHVIAPSWSESAAAIEIGESRISPSGSTGQAADVAWDLRWQPGPVVFRPGTSLSTRTRMFDMRSAMEPYARFSGSITVAGESFAVDDQPGLLVRYMGRRLFDRWWWISANEFEGEPGRRVEAFVGPSSLWGRGPVRLPLGYLWTSDGTRHDRTVSPVNGVIRARRLPDGVEIRSARPGSGHRIVVRAPASAFRDIGDSISQTLIADLEIDGVHAVPGTVGFEERRLA
jgi:hypothetical protein